ncbi:hypothetical protein EVAR_19385_1 [Eumeta japonica]|uniref:Uncharacterized protein n=1 Tax=Eumeta variegata TaxID=151549 RepID=A0A4C1TRG6_EUMVA|nr:hypothetical protein EVAR_19385_1 [Eumeta japonica]
MISGHSVDRSFKPPIIHVLVYDVTLPPVQAYHQNCKLIADAASDPRIAIMCYSYCGSRKRRSPLKVVANIAPIMQNDAVGEVAEHRIHQSSKNSHANQIGGILRKDQILRTRNLRACTIRSMDLSEARGVCEDPGEICLRLPVREIGKYETSRRRRRVGVFYHVRFRLRWRGGSGGGSRRPNARTNQAPNEINYHATKTRRPRASSVFGAAAQVRRFRTMYPPASRSASTFEDVTMLK